MMYIPVEIRRDRSNLGGAGIALVGLGSVTIGVLKLGFLVTLAVATITMVLGFGGLRLWSAWWRRRISVSSGTGCLLTASATLEGDTGVLTVTRTAVRWARGELEMVYRRGEIEKATIRPLPLVGAAELQLRTADGADVLLTVTAPARTIEMAFSCE